MTEPFPPIPDPDTYEAAVARKAWLDARIVELNAERAATRARLGDAPGPDDPEYPEYRALGREIIDLAKVVQALKPHLHALKPPPVVLSHEQYVAFQRILEANVQLVDEGTAFAELLPDDCALLRSHVERMVRLRPSWRTLPAAKPRAQASNEPVPG